MNASSVSGRYARLLQILSHLQSGGGLNADELAGQLACLSAHHLSGPEFDARGRGGDQFR